MFSLIIKSTRQFTYRKYSKWIKNNSLIGKQNHKKSKYLQGANIYENYITKWFIFKTLQIIYSTKMVKALKLLQTILENKL